MRIDPWFAPAYPDGAARGHPGGNTTMLRRIGSPQNLALCMDALLALAGCSNMPTQPLSSNQPVSSTNVTSGGQAQVLSLNLLGGSTSSGTKTATVGILGGVISAGDFTLVIPPLALTQS